MKIHVRYFLIVLWLFATTTVHAQDWMPDPALREAVREKLGIPADSPLTQAHVQLHLTTLDAREKEIVDLTGLAHATDLQFLALRMNKIHDLSPLSGLIGLVHLTLGGNQITDISPLAGLVNLEVLELGGNQIRDVSPLAGLVNLKRLNINNNPIADISSLMGLENLEDLRIRNLDGDVFSTIPIPKLIQFGYDESCDLEGVPISERIENREYPSIFSAFGNIMNLPSLSWREKLAHHDLFISSLPFDSMKWLPTPEGLKTFVHVESAKAEWEERLSLNPNMLSIVAMNYQAANPGEYPDDWPYWVRDESENIIQAEEHGTLLIDFTYPEIQDYLVRQAVEFAQCGLFDGILFDWWRDEWQYRKDARYYAHDVHEAAITMLRRIREGVDEVRDDFLILVNSNRTQIPRSAPYVNGMSMETVNSPLYGYTHQDLIEIESTLLWGEQHLRKPQVNCLEGWGLPSEPVDSPRNQQWMRLLTTMSLTHSDGFVRLFSGIPTLTLNHTHFYDLQHGIEKEHSEVHKRGLPHSHPEHFWYDFYDTPLGRPIGGDETKGVLYVNRDGVPIEGLFIREFTGGWAVYNRSGREQQIELPEKVSGVTSGVNAQRSHVLPDLDGEIYLKPESGLETPPTVDVNGDGTVNILDLVVVANAFGEAEPDVNGDKIVNILDLVIVANAFE